MLKRLAWAGALLALLTGNVFAAERYKLLSTAQPTSVSDKVEVVELFWYGCPHCFDLEPVMQEWLETKPDYVEYVRVPAIFRDNWIPLARAWYLIDMLELGERVHMNLFRALHEKKLNMNNVGLLRSFFEHEGVTKEQFDKLYHSFSIDSMTRNAAKLTRDYQITGVPAIIVNGRYMTSVSLTGSHEGLIEEIERLAHQEAEAMGLLPVAAAGAAATETAAAN
ncbi:MAG TPA: disulfide bond formation protein DsbA [Gammaproteobacteria bacterium]|nr:disulfide bond formation protein DsbA [Gammaproteobacteria bacterium]